MRDRSGRDGGNCKTAVRTVVVTSADAGFRSRLRQQLTAMRWQVREAGGGAEALAQLEIQAAEAMVLDSVLPDLEVGEFAEEIRSRHPVMEVLRIDRAVDEAGARSPRRNELLHALRQAQREIRRGASGELPAWESAPTGPPRSSAAVAVAEVAQLPEAVGTKAGDDPDETRPKVEWVASIAGEVGQSFRQQANAAVLSRVAPLPEMVGESAGMLELAKLVRLVAPRSTTVLIEGDTGTGKELVAKAVHQLSGRSSKPFQVLNCAAIPESLLEAELFGHTRGAFTGAVQSRQGRIEAANGGTLFLDEIGEMPLALQAKMLRFLESGELQRVGDNEMLRVDVRVVAASHQPLQKRAKEGTFRLDLYHRLAVFPIRIPALRERMEDVLPLAEYLLARLGEDMPVKRLSAGAAARLQEYDWPGNVRELAHVLERGAILAEGRREIAREEIRF
jgi:DNA-binding NtrC family response regulator